MLAKSSTVWFVIRLCNHSWSFLQNRNQILKWKQLCHVKNAKVMDINSQMASYKKPIVVGLWLGCLTLLSTIFQLYRPISVRGRNNHMAFCREPISVLDINNQMAFNSKLAMVCDTAFRWMLCNICSKRRKLTSWKFLFEIYNKLDRSKIM